MTLDSRFVFVLLVSVALAGCSQQHKRASESDATTKALKAGSTKAASEAATVDAHKADGSTIGGDGSPITLNALSPADLAGATLTGELACSFTAQGAATLLLARGGVASNEASRGVVKVADYVEAIGAPGGYDGMIGGAHFSGQGKTVVIALTGPAQGVGESPPRPATLTYQRADGASRVFAGSWTCGP